MYEAMSDLTSTERSSLKITKEINKLKDLISNEENKELELQNIISKTEVIIHQ